MKTNKILAGMLVVLGFGSVVGCSATRAKKSEPRQPVVVTDSLTTIEEPIIRVMYGVNNVPFRVIEPVPEQTTEQPQ
jgi:hypothetical protein